MARVKEKEINEIVRCLKTYGPTTFHILLAALLTWLFGVLVFIPIANSINRLAGFFCSLIVFVAFTVLLCASLPSFKKTVDALSTLPGRKYGSRLKIKEEDSITLFKNIAYLVFTLILYGFYLPLLTNVHPAFSGIVLILVLIWVLFLVIRIVSILSSRILDYLLKSE